MNWQRTFGVVQPTVENRSLAEEASESKLRIAAVDLAIAADGMLNVPQFGRASVTYLDDAPDFVFDLTLLSPTESPRLVQRAASRAAFEVAEVRRTAGENYPKYEHDAQASVHETDLLALRAGKFLSAACLTASDEYAQAELDDELAALDELFALL